MYFAIYMLVNRHAHETDKFHLMLIFLKYDLPPALFFGYNAVIGFCFL